MVTKVSLVLHHNCWCLYFIMCDVSCQVEPHLFPFFVFFFSPVFLRYNMFIVMYPLGVIGELLTIHVSLPYVRRSGMYSLRLPNKYNVSFDYYYFLIIVMLSYIPCKNSTHNKTSTCMLLFPHWGCHVSVTRPAESVFIMLTVLLLEGIN